MHLLDRPGSFGSFPDSPELPFVPPEVDDVLDEEPDPHWQLLLLRQPLETLEILIHANLKTREEHLIEKQ